MTHLRSGLVASALSFIFVTSGAAGQTPSAPISAAERAAIFKAAGFTPKGAQFVRCGDDPSASYMPGSIELADLNGDGHPEAWVKESSLFCYGNTAEAFVLLSKTSKGGWIRLLDAVGVPTVRTTKTAGWPDIEVGGPGSGPFPIYRFNGRTYTQGK